MKTTTKKNEILNRLAIAAVTVAGIAAIVLQFAHYNETILRPAGL